jgi:putative restriction endonuclease
LDNFQEGLQEVCDFDWAGIENPFGFAESGDSYESIVTELTHDPASSGEIYTRIRARGIKQILFREALIKAYSCRCAFTGISTVEALEACHIVPWSQASSAERLDVRNGLLLNSLHHKLFDCGHITLNANHRIVYRAPSAENRKCSSLEQKLTIGLHGNRLYLPHRVELRPSIKYIAKHHEVVGWEAKELEI